MNGGESRISLDDYYLKAEYSSEWVILIKISMTNGDWVSFWSEKPYKTLPELFSLEAPHTHSSFLDISSSSGSLLFV